MPNTLFNEQINTEYMPSQSVLNAKDYFEAWAINSAAVRASYPPTEVAYGQTPHERYDVFEPNISEPNMSEPNSLEPNSLEQGDLEYPRATLFFIHGGYWQAFYKDTFSYMALSLLKQNIRVVVPSYQLNPEVKLETIIGQMQKAASLVGKTYPEPLYLAGHSAGGHLAAMLHSSNWDALGLIAPKIAGSIGISGLYDLAPLRHTELQPELQLSETEAYHLSPIHQKPSIDAPFLVAVGELETAAFYTQAAALTNAWAEIASQPINLSQRHHFNAPDDLPMLLQILMS